MRKIIVLLLCAFLLVGCSAKDWEEQTTTETQDGVKIYDSDSGTSFDLEKLPYDMQYNDKILQYVSCEFYQEKSDENYTYTPYIIAKINVSGLDEETLHWFDEDTFINVTLTSEKNELTGYDLYKTCVIDDGDYRYYIYSDNIFGDGYRYDFTEAHYSFDFVISQADKVTYELADNEHTDNRKMSYCYYGNTENNVKHLTEIGDEIWYKIKQKQLENLR